MSCMPRSSEPVGQAFAQGMSGQSRQGSSRGTKCGVPSGMPAAALASLSIP